MKQIPATKTRLSRNANRGAGAGDVGRMGGGA